MALPAFRAMDLHACDAHGAAPMPSASSPDVKTNGRPQARAGDEFPCGGCPNKVRSGAATVTVNGEFAGRSLGKSDHPGTLLTGSSNVVIGGPTGVGCAGAGRSTCLAMAAGRASGTTSQSYGNCVLESVRQLVRRAGGREVTEDEMLVAGFEEGAVNKVGTESHGGADGSIGAALLSRFGVPAERMPEGGPATLGTVKQAIQEGRGVVAFVDPHEFAPDRYGSGNHAVVVTAVELDDEGNVTAVFLNDTGTGVCGQKVSAERFGAALRNLPAERDRGGAALLVTKGPIW